MSRIPRIYKYIIIITINISFALFILILYSNYLHRDLTSSIHIPISVEGDWPLEGDKHVGFIRNKNTASYRTDHNTGIGYSMFSDRRGARVNAIGQQTPDSIDILTIGGSFSEGHGMNNEKTFTSILGRKLNVSVANFALGSYGTFQSLQLLERNAD